MAVWVWKPLGGHLRLNSSCQKLHRHLGVVRNDGKRERNSSERNQQIMRKEAACELGVPHILRALAAGFSALAAGFSALAVGFSALAAGFSALAAAMPRSHSSMLLSNPENWPLVHSVGDSIILEASPC